LGNDLGMKAVASKLHRRFLQSHEISPRKDILNIKERYSYIAKQTRLLKEDMQRSQEKIQFEVRMR